MIPTLEEFLDKMDGPMESLKPFYEELVASGRPVGEWQSYAERIVLQAPPEVHYSPRWMAAYNVASNAHLLADTDTPDTEN